jgi:hypothetical protein
MKEIRVTDFGAVPDDGRDDTQAILAALEECKRHDPAVLVFPKGQYDVHAGSNPRNQWVLFPVSGHNGLTVDGKGSVLMVHGITGLFWFEKCSDLMLTNLVVDCARPPFSQGKVLAAEGNHFDVEVFSDYPVQGGEKVEAYMDYDAQTRLPMRHGLDEYYTVVRTELLRPQVLRVYLNNAARVKPGVLVVLRHQVYSYNAFVCARCQDVNVRDVTVYTIPGMAWVAQVCTNVTMQRFRVVPRPGSGRMMSTTADATHFGGCKGTIRMTECVFEGMGDDGVNIKSGLYLSLLRKIDRHTVQARHNLKMVDSPDPGDVMEISHVEDLLPYATATVKRVELLEDGVQRLEFESPLPADLREGDVFGNATRVPRVRISDCEVRNNRARGMLIQTRDAVIENCRFRGCTSAGILVLTEVAHFFESIGTRDVTVRGCTFEGVNYGAAMTPGALCAMAYLKDFTYPPKPGIHRRITFEANTIRQTNNSAIFVAGVDEITLRNNRIELACDSPTLDTGGYAIYVRSSRNVRLSGNRILPQRQGKGFRESMGWGEDMERASPR